MGMLLFWVAFVLPLITWSSGGITSRLLEIAEVPPLAEPNLVGPENLCIVFGGVIGTYSAGGNPTTDVYTWLVLDPAGKEIFSRSGGAQFETIKVSFNEIGNYSLKLSIRRNSATIYEKDLRIQVQKGPELALLPDYLLCGDSPTTLTAIDPSTPNLNQYTFKWTDIADNPIGNTNSVQVNKEGFYKIELFLRGSNGQPVCLINASTYVGPSLDFELTLDKSKLCLGESINASTDTPLTGDWFLIKPNKPSRVPLGNAFGLEIIPDTLSIPGQYTLIFSAVDPKYPGCLSERKVTFEVLSPPQLSISIINKPDNCAEPNGILELRSAVSLDSLFIVETGFLVTKTSPNQVFTIGNLGPQIYTIGAFVNGCKFLTLFDLTAKDPPIINANTPQIEIPNYSIKDESCTETGSIPGSIRLDFKQGKVKGEYRILSQNFGEIQLGKITDQDFLEVLLPGGDYLFELKIDGCTYPTREFTIPIKDQVIFTNPKAITICQSFNFTPETSQNLKFTLTYPDLSKQTLAAGQPFILTQGGDYELLGVPADPSSGLCPRVEKFTATLAGAFDFELILLEEDCFGNQVYKAELQGLLPEQTSIRWLNADGEIVGRSQLFFPTSIGDHSLIVQPLQSGFCPLTPIPFTISSPILAVDVDLEANKICPDPGTSNIRLTTNENAVTKVEWIFFDDQGNRRNLTEFADQREIIVETPGNYEAVVFNRIGCEIGRNFIKVELSTLLTLPEVKDRYGICARGKTGPQIDPGDFAKYEWYLDDRLVSEEPIFSPKEVGMYTLWVTTADGCLFSAEFEAFDACLFQYRFTNAMVLDDFNRKFEVWVDEGVTSVEVFVINRQGELIYYNKSIEIPLEKAVFSWDGKMNGKPILPGTYAIILVGENPLYEYYEKVTSSLLVID